MKREPNARDAELRYIGLDVHKLYITAGGMNEKQEIVMRRRKCLKMRHAKRSALPALGVSKGQLHVLLAAPRWKCGLSGFISQ